MENKEIFIGTLDELASELLTEYISKTEFAKTQINYSPKEDCVAISEITAQEKSLTLSLSLSNENDKQIDGVKVFSDEYMNGFSDKILRKGQVYQLSFVFAYIIKNAEVKCQYPALSGKWEEWENYWKSNSLNKSCVAFAAVNLLEGKSLYKSVTLETLNKSISQIKKDMSTVSQAHNKTYIFDIAKLKEESLLNITTGDVEQTGNEVYPYSVKFVQQLNYGITNQVTGELTSYVNADLGIKYYKRMQWEPTTLGGNLDVLYVGDNLSIGYPHKLQNVISTVMGANIIINSQVELVQTSNRQYIEITTTANFPNSPTEVNINNIKDYLNGDVNARGRCAKEIYIRVEVIDTMEVEVL